MLRKRNKRVLTISSFKIVVLIFVIFAVIIYFFFIHGDYGLYQYWKLRHEKEALQSNINALKAEQAALKKEIELLKNDKQYIEKIARERYKMGREKETVYYVRSDSLKQK